MHIKGQELCLSLFLVCDIAHVLVRFCFVVDDLVVFMFVKARQAAFHAGRLPLMGLLAFGLPHVAFANTTT